MTPPDLSDAYANAAHIPGGPDFPARWSASAAAFREAHPPEDVPYGAHPRERLHLFRPPGTPRGLLLLVHGGYWMAFSASDFSHLARGPLSRGWAVAMPSYPLCPEATVGGIVRSCATALDLAAERISGPIRLAGHSAGGQIAARLAGMRLPCRDRVERAVPISPLSMLAPLRLTAMNATLGLTPEEAAAESPALHPRPHRPVTVWVGEAERPAFRDQALWLSRAWGAALVVEPQRHHFDVIAGLEDPESPLCEAVAG